ncbi:MAG: hypothetical protein RXN84_03500 [Caldivirga sp.]|jgi:hypothetical protein
MPKQGKGDSGFKPILIMLKDAVLLVTRSSVRILELDENDDFDAGELYSRLLRSGVKCIDVDGGGAFRVVDCTELEEEFMSEVEDLIEDSGFEEE